MLRSLVKLRLPLMQTASKVGKQYGKQYGALARAEVEDVRVDRNAIREQPGDQDEKHETYYIYKTETPSKLHFNLEDFDKELQTVFVDRYLDTLKRYLDSNCVRRLSFNYINEDVFRYQLSIPIRKLGYKSSFERYNNDRGLAVFKLEEHEGNASSRGTGAYHRMAYTKSRKTDILNLTM